MLADLKRDIQIHKRSLSYEGMLIMLNYRFGVWAKSLPQPFRGICSKLYGLGYMWTTLVTHIHLSRDTPVGEGIHFIHGGTVHIHSRCKIGKRCGIMHGVTLGAATSDAVPVVGDDVFIGANAVILGGVKIGDRARIAANALVLSDVPEGYTAIGNPAKMVPPFGFTLQDKKDKKQDTSPEKNPESDGEPSANRDVVEPLPKMAADSKNAN